MYATKVLIICDVHVDNREAAGLIFRHLAARGNEVTLFDMSMMPWDWHVDVEETLKQMQFLHVVDLMEASDATLLVTDEYSACLVQMMHELYKMTSRKINRSSYVWEQNGVSCVILGGSVKKSTVARHLWEVFSDQQELDLTDIFPYGSPKFYNTDYTKETAQAAVL